MPLAARTEGIVLDPTYTGRAMAGLVAAVADGTVRPGTRTVFLHSDGDTVGTRREPSTVVAICRALRRQRGRR